ncbi:hypothetical protein D3C71_1702510 [compost metagenome]
MYRIKDPIRIDGSHTAAGVTHDHNLFGTQLINGYQHTTHDTTERLGNNRARILDKLGIPIAQVHSFWQELDQAGIHTGHNNQFLRWELVRNITFVFFFLDKLLVVVKNFVKVAHCHIPPLIYRI